MTPPADPDRPRIYRAFGLTVQSAMDLPELRADLAVTAPDVHLVLGPVTPPEDRPPALAPAVWAGPECFVMDVPGVAAIEARGGNRLIVEAKPGAPETDIRAYVLGSAMGALLHQRGRLPLHAGAVETGGGVAAFTGPSGAGKSTLVLALHDLGLPLAADDICVADLTADGQALVSPGLIRLKLWRQSLAASGRTADGLTPVAGGLDKHQLPAETVAADADLPLRALYVLSRADDAPPGIRRLRGVAAARAFIDNTFRGHLVGPMGRSTAHFDQCMALARTVPVFEFSRTWDLSGVADDARRIAEHLARPGEFAPAEGFDFQPRMPEQ